MKDTTNWKKEKDPLKALFNIYQNFGRWKPAARERFFRQFDRHAAQIGDERVNVLISELRKVFMEVPNAKSN